jgi:ABC-type siderophore export system fused ATPase/permease subunit
MAIMDKTRSTSDDLQRVIETINNGYQEQANNKHRKGAFHAN